MKYWMFLLRTVGMFSGQDKNLFFKSFSWPSDFIFLFAEEENIACSGLDLSDTVKKDSEYFERRSL